MSRIEKLDTSMAVPSIEGDVEWRDVAAMGIEGKGWPDTGRFYDRLPACAQERVRPAVWNLSHDSAGMAVRFETDSRSISARWTCLHNNLAMNHMPATGVSGLDLYARCQGNWRWAGVGRPAARTTSTALVQSLDTGRREYMLYLPLYNGVESVEIGVAKGAGFWSAPPRQHKPIVFYGTSIAQGGCASRPGMVYTSILGRRLDRPTINLGFSGNAQTEPEVADLMAQLDASAFVLDALPNMSGLAGELTQRTLYMVRTLRKARPAAPIVLVEDRTMANAWIVSKKRDNHAAMRKAYLAAYEQLLAEGAGGLHYVKGDMLLGSDDEGTVDCSHATDLGFMRMADLLEPILRPLV